MNNTLNLTVDFQNVKLVQENFKKLTDEVSDLREKNIKLRLELQTLRFKESQEQRIRSLEHDHKVMREALESIGKVCDQATNIKVATYDTVDDVSDLSRTALSSLLVKDGE